jgi:hypothetical protein
MPLRIFDPRIVFDGFEQSLLCPNQLVVPLCRKTIVGVPIILHEGFEPVRSLFPETNSIQVYQEDARYANHHFLLVPIQVCSVELICVLIH